MKKPSPARVLVADPPWPFKDRLPGHKDGIRGSAAHYGLLSIDDIKAFPLPPLQDNALLFMWRVSSMVEEAYSVVRAWGFVPKSELVWLKRTVHGKRHFGMGRYTRAEHESCIIAVRGRAKIEDRSIRSTFEAEIGEHSEKPDRFYEIVQQLSLGPYAALFERKVRAGWRQYGDELGRPHP